MKVSISNDHSTMTKEFPASDAEYEAWCCRLIEGEKAYIDGVCDLFIRNMSESMDKVREEVLGVVFPRGFVNRGDFDYPGYNCWGVAIPQETSAEDLVEQIFDYWEELKMKGRKNMKTDKIIVIMDRSGSMEPLVDDTIGGFNSFIEDQKKVGENAIVTLIQFDNQYDVVYKNVPIGHVRPLNHDTFVPRGTTALLDAIGKTMNTFESEFCPTCCVRNIYVIITDGQENASKVFTRKQIFDKINRATECHKSKFIFLAANQDAIAEGGSLGIDSKWCHTYEGTGIGTQIMYNTSSCMVRDIRTNGDSD